MITDMPVVILRATLTAVENLSKFIRKIVTPSVIVTITLVSIVISAPARGQSVPEPPQKLCVVESGNCDDDPNIGSTGGVKWNPGHYIKTQGNPSKADPSDFLNSVGRALNKVDDSPLIRGGLVQYSWGMLEPSLGKYDFRPIQDHLDFLSSRGKKLILFVDFKCFGTDCSNLAPAELSGEVITTTREYPTHIVEVWEEKNMNHYIALWEAIAARFDNHPALEIVMSGESVPSLQQQTPVNYTRETYANQLKRLYKAQGNAFKSTAVVANVNFLSGQVAGLIETAYLSGVGRALPDIFDSDGSVVFRGECLDNECGARDYRRQVPHVGIVSQPTLAGVHGAATDSPREVLQYGAANKFTHYAWVSDEAGEDSWSNIISAIENDSGSVYAVCPRIYSQGCQ